MNIFLTRKHTVIQINLFTEFSTVFLGYKLISLKSLTKIGTIKAKL